VAKALPSHAGISGAWDPEAGWHDREARVLLALRSGRRRYGPLTEPDGTTVRLAYFSCFAGVAGDMALGALLDAGAPLQEVMALLERLPIGGWSLEAEPVQRAGIGATNVRVLAHDDVVVRTFAHIVGILEEARLPERVHDRALRTFRRLAEAEARIHRRPVGQVHFHEAGAHDAIIEVVGVACALETLDVATVAASELAVGQGALRGPHGLLPNPAPAVLELARGVPLRSLEVHAELTTPTGAAIVTTLAASFGPLPPMAVEAIGFGAGSRELHGVPNVTEVVLGSATGAQPDWGAAGAPLHAMREAPGPQGASETSGVAGGQPLVVLETNLDDVTGEVIARTIEALLDAGAYDAWALPAVMKKGRPGHVLAAICEPALHDALRSVIRRETGTFGVRSTPVWRHAAAREEHVVEVEGIPVRVKIGPGRAKPEPADLARVARLRGLPLREANRLAEQAWYEAHEKPERQPPTES
jgi:uncharacterized protein (TIGR00299 family) protein